MRRIIFATLLLAACQSTPVVIEPTPGNVAQQFEVAAFGSDYGPGTDLLRRWEGDLHWGWLRTAQAPKYSNEHYPRIASIMRQISQDANVRWAEAKTADDLNFVFAFMPRSEFSTVQDQIASGLSSGQLCAGVILFDETSGSISKAFTFFGTDNSDQIIRDCILEEIYQAMGLPADACHYRPSVICEQDRVFELTEADKIMLRTLYDPRLKPGMTKAEAMPIARQIIAEQMR